MAKKVKLKGAGKPKSQNPETLKEATVYSDPRMEYYRRSFDELKKGAAYEGESEKRKAYYGKRDYDAFMNAEKNGYYKDDFYDKKIVREGLFVAKSKPGDADVDFVFDEDRYPDYIKEALSKGMEIDFAIWGPESLPVYFLKKPQPARVDAKPKTIESSRPNLKIRKPVEEEILDIRYTQGGDKVKVSTNFGEQVMSREDYVDFYKKFKDKIQSFREAKGKKVRRIRRK